MLVIDSDKRALAKDLLSYVNIKQLKGVLEPEEDQKL
jgi:hypothetical protein